MRSIFAATLLATVLAPSALASYDSTWYRAEFWSGEYPNGFTVSAPTMLKIRSEATPEAERTIDCALKANATYHPWNMDRVKSDGLEFLSFTKIAEMTLKSAMSVKLLTEGASEPSTEVQIDFAKGDKWKYLAYLAEGAFLMEHDGRQFLGDQGLFENSTSSWPDQGEEGYHEWLKLTCANGATGWILMSDLANETTLALPNVIGYADARDLGK